MAAAWGRFVCSGTAPLTTANNFFGRNTSAVNMLGVQESVGDGLRSFYLGHPDFDSLSRPSYTDMSMGSYGAISYGKTATMLLTLESIVGEPALRNALHTYFMKYRFTHPTQQDFMHTVNEATGQDLKWYWDQAVYGTQVLDYEVLRADSDPIDWYDDNDTEKGETSYETQIILHRKGDFIFPVVAEIKFDNGETTLERWDGQDRWVRYVFRKKAKLESVQIDPGYQVTLDRDYLNNSRVIKPQRAATAKITAYWMFLTQFLAQLLSWLA